MRGRGEVDAFGDGEVGEGAVAEVYASESAQVVAEVGGEECAVDVAVGEVFVALVEGVGEGLVVEQGEHAVAVAADHAPVAPGDGGGEEGGNFDVGERGEPAGELHGVVGDECRGVDARGLGVEEVAQFALRQIYGKIFGHMVYFSGWRRWRARRRTWAERAGR